jgi:NTP pyrophosphatase (non-canonical NTP hydrolase)
MGERPTDKWFRTEVVVELSRARRKFPSSVLSMAALTEEVGELAQALLKWRAGKGTWAEVESEAIQVACMAQRVAVEGDASFEAADYSEPSP